MADFQAKVTVDEDETAATASNPQPVVAENGKTATVVDELGRTITVRKLGPLDRMRLFRVVGAEASENGQYMGLAALAACVTAIDGVQKSFPLNQIQLDSMVQSLEDEGFNAIVRAMLAMNPAKKEVEEDARFLSSERT